MQPLEFESKKNWLPKSRLITTLDRYQVPNTVGNKAKNLHFLSRHKRKIPNTIVCTYQAYERYVADDLSLIGELKDELQRTIDPKKNYAIRSSANFEDSADISFAGQFKSVLNVQGTDQIIQAIWSIWSSAQSEQVLSYLESAQLPQEGLRMAVIIQEMVSPEVSGVSLSKNPVQGTDEIIIEAVQGMGDKLVQGGATPARWVNKWGYWLEEPGEKLFPKDIVDDIARQTKEIERTVGFPVDLEWVYDGENIFWVQMREITTLGNKTIYSNYISKEFLPGMIKPLIYSINVPLVNGVWIDWISEVTGKLNVAPEDLAKQIYYRVYFNLDSLGKIFASLGFPKEGVEMLMGIIPRGAARPSFKPTLKTFTRLPWMLAFAINKWFLAPKMRRAMKRIDKYLKGLDYQNIDHLSSMEIIQRIDQHLEVMKEAAYYNVLGPLFMGMYNTVLEGRLEDIGIKFLEFDLVGDMEEIQYYDPDNSIKCLHEQFTQLPENIQSDLALGKIPPYSDHPEFQTFIQDFNQLIDTFGHLSDNGNDFSSTPWRESPEVVMGLITSYKPSRAEESLKIRYSDLKVAGSKKLILKLFYNRAREYRMLREEISSLYTFGYGLFRYYYLALGKKFQEDGILDQIDDIYFLTDSEIRDLLDSKLDLESSKEIIQKHKQDMARFENISLPNVVIGNEIPPIETRKSQVILGVASSIGVHTGRAKKVAGLSDLQKVQDGDVLVISYSDVSWTPLFRRAGAVIAESGGLLSHSSIVAREYGIPAVVNVAEAMTLEDNDLVTVDGNQGKVLILTAES